MTSRDDRLMRVIDHLLDRIEALEKQIELEKSFARDLQKIVEAPNDN